MKKHLKNFGLWIFRQQVTARIYMKSGNVIVLKNLNNISVKKVNSQVTELHWETGFNIKGQKVLNINVDQIEAVIAK